MELYGRGQPCQYIERFTTLLSKGLVRPWLRGQGPEGGVTVLGGGWKMGGAGGVMLRHGGRQRTGLDGSRPVNPVG